VLVTVLLVLAFLAYGPRLSLDRFKSVDAWVTDLASDERDTREAAARFLGENPASSLRFLMKELGYAESTFKRKLRQFIEKQRWVKVNWRTEADHHMAAMRGLQVLGPAAREAIPALAPFLNAPETSPASAETLASIGSNSVSVLTQAQTNQNPHIRAVAAAALGWIVPSAEAAVPVLLRCLKDPDEEVRVSAVAALGQIGPDPDLAIPELIACLADSFPFVREQAARALCGYREGAKRAVDPLLNLLSDSNRSVREEAAVALFLIDPAVARTRGIRVRSVLMDKDYMAIDNVLYSKPPIARRTGQPVYLHFLESVDQGKSQNGQR
jgi:hypothetical protein